MSTNALPYEKQIRHIMIFNAVDATTTSPTFLATGVAGNIIITGEGGAPWTSPKDLLITKKTTQGKIVKSDLITPKDTVYLKGTAPRAKVGKIQVLTVTGAPVAGTVYTIDLKVNYATSEENFTSFLAQTQAIAGDTVTTVATRLAKSLSDQLDNSIYTGYQGGKGTEVIIAGTNGYINKYFKISVVAGAITIQEKDFILTNYVVGLRAFDTLMWNAVGKASTDVYGQPSVSIPVVTTPGVVAKGAGYQIKELEHYLGSHLKEYGTPDITLGFNAPYDADVNKQYYTIDLKYSDVSRNDPYKSDKMLFFATDSLIEANKVGNALAAATGLAWVDFV
jgi:hypothetical protein